jgi:hypothetical protein
MERVGNEKRKNMIWRADMDGFLLDLLRGVVVRSLRWSLVHSKSKGVVHCIGIEHAETLGDVACILQISSQTSQAMLKATADVQACIDRCDALTDELRELKKWVRRREGKSGFRDFNVPAQVLMSASIPRLNPAIRSPPLEYPTIQYRDTRIPLYNLEELLGEEKTKELLEDTIFKKSEYLVVKEGRLTAGAQMALMKLQGYLT